MINNGHWQNIYNQLYGNETGNINKRLRNYACYPYHMRLNLAFLYVRIILAFLYVRRAEASSYLFLNSC